MSVVSDISGRFWPMNNLRSYRFDGDAWLADFGDPSQEVRVAQYAWQEALDRWTQSTFPAAPGTYVLNLDAENGDGWDGDGFDSEVVLGWAVTARGDILPITVHGIEVRAQAILHPDGRVERPQVDSHRTRADYAATVRRELQAMAQE